MCKRDASIDHGLRLLMLLLLFVAASARFGGRAALGGSIAAQLLLPSFRQQPTRHQADAIKIAAPLYRRWPTGCCSA